MRHFNLLLFLLVIGFTVGDELGFSESLSNVEGNRRRSTQNNRFQNALLAANAQKQANNRITVVQPPQVQAQPVPTPLNNTLKPAAQPVQAQPKAYNKMTPTVPPFKPIPPAPERPITMSNDRIMTLTAINMSKPVRVGNAPTPAIVGVAVPAFQAMPASISRISSAQAVTAEKPVKPSIMAVVMNPASMADKIERDNKIVNNIPPIKLPTAIPQTNSIQALASITNISMEAIEAAIMMRQQQLMKQKYQQTTTTTTTPVPTHRPTTSAPPKRHLTSTSKVMNAPKEYYPVGYDKNFDDNFASKVELPDTSFYCGDQKHFPGLYADEDLGCMVFHVCALTDDGLIMKSFLCPESTLFDQTILKCNWWFYVDCKNSKKLYDSNIPISKSYQLMKALTFFSSYKKDQNGKN